MSATLDQTLAALADPARRGVIDLLRKKPRRAGEFAEAMEMSAPAMSRHLRILRGSGLIAEEKQSVDGRARLYRIAPDRFALLRDWIAEVEAVWTLELSAFKAHAGSTRGDKSSARASKSGKSGKADKSSPSSKKK